MSLVLLGSTSGSITLQEPAVAGSTTLTLPATTGNVVVDTATQTLTNKTLTSPTLTTPNIDSAQFATVSGTAPIYPCRAWCSLNGTGTIAIRGSGNISSVTDLGTGNYQYNFATAMPDANYGTSYSDYVWGVGYTDNFTTTYFRSQTVNSTFVPTDPAWVQVAVFR